uniref:Uncharacterized protein n=1 Tax=uncultured Desulfobacterium sp. TaxID=201089 RepID=E1YA40_9BACT|nr:unknown protein [uncultured Desulfobacterium sp.]CBX27445.1 unknown protein [uncultured Desulfobacterium sp.]CBX27612.1 unknown protein [uncultured Desulfobacterium sp.]CBX28214.1 unknown protein [uncultured Desulfobacterium sp.]CBX28282.1 unknown protein [uncultured Desulfobacterium sp.]
MLTSAKYPFNALHIKDVLEGIAVKDSKDSFGDNSCPQEFIYMQIMMQNKENIIPAE